MLIVLLLAARCWTSTCLCRGETREFSAAQLLDGLGSTVSSDVEGDDLQNTREWRLDWWQTIWDYTVDGPYFWTGKGYGINLASDDGFQTDPVERDPEKPAQFAHHLPGALRCPGLSALDYSANYVAWLDACLISEGKTIGKASMGRTVRLGHLLLGGIRDRCQLRRFSGKSYGCHPILDDLRPGMGRSHDIQPIPGTGSEIARFEIEMNTGACSRSRIAADAARSARDTSMGVYNASACRVLARRLGNAARLASDIRNILVIKLDRLGDIILASPFFRELRRNFPDGNDHSRNLRRINRDNAIMPLCEPGGACACKSA